MSAYNQNQNSNPPQPPLDPKQLEQLNAYLDYELSEAEREQVRDLLRRSPAAENELATLRATRQVMRELPDAAAPHRFVVRPYMLEQPARRPAFSIFGGRLSPAFGLSLGSIAAASLLVLVLVVQLATSSMTNQTASTATLAQATAAAAQPRGANGPTSDSFTAAAAATSTAPPSVAYSAAPAPTQPSPAAKAAPPTAIADNPTTTLDATAPSPANGNGNAGSSTSGAAVASESAPTATPNTNPAYTYSAPSATSSPSPELQMQANNPADSGGNINATNPGLPSQNTNRTGDNLNPYQRGMDYWLILEITLAILVVALGLGAIIAQRRTR